MEDYNLSHKGHQISHILYTNLIVRQMRKLSMRVTEANMKILFFESNRFSKRQTKSSYRFDYSLGNYWNQDREDIIINGNP